MKNIIIAVALSIMAPNISLAGSLTNAQRNIIENTLEVKLMVGNCPNLKFGRLFNQSISLAGSIFGVRSEELNGQGRAASLHRKLVQEHDRLYAKHSKIYCMSSLHMYGSNGTRVKDMVEER